MTGQITVYLTTMYPGNPILRVGMSEARMQCGWMWPRNYYSQNTPARQDFQKKQNSAYVAG